MPDNMKSFKKITIRILKENFLYLKSYCGLNDIKIQTFVDSAIREKLKRETSKSNQD